MTTKKKPVMSGPQAAISVLNDEGGPLHIKEITSRVIAKYDTPLGKNGKTPVATLGAMLYIDANKGRTFLKTAPGTFGLLALEPPGRVETLDNPAVTPNAVVVRKGRKAVA
jgi:hypothetical protein